MGNIKKQRKKYSTPAHPWQKARIDEEKEITKEYGLKNKKSIWRMESILENFKKQSKKLVALTTKQAEKEKEQILKRLQKMGLLSMTANMGDVLNLELKDIMERRLQTIVYKKNLARTINQARQFIIHNHITVSGKKITMPSYIVLKSEENSVSFVVSSSLSKEDHPERKADEIKKEVKAVKKETKRKAVKVKKKPKG